MNQLGRDMHRLSRDKTPGFQRRSRLGAQYQFALEDVHRLVLQVVVLETQDVPRLHVENLAHVAIGASPDQFVAPWLIDTVRQIGHQASRGGSWNDEGDVMQARTQTPQPTQPSALMTG